VTIVLEHYFRAHGIPTAIVSDCGKVGFVVCPPFGFQLGCGEVGRRSVCR
jgi:hypothetical protein